jgi:hypothetical protein
LLFKAKRKLIRGDVLKMKGSIFGIMLLVSCSLMVAAQATDNKKGEIFAGYSNGQIDTGVDSGSSINAFFRDRENFNGFEVSGVYNLGRYFGVKGDFSAHFNSQRFSEVFPGPVGTTTTVNVKNDNSLYNFLGGVQVKDNSQSGRWKPFAHALVGAAHARAKFSELTCTTSTGTTCPTGFSNDTFSDTGLAGALGGGLDIRINNNFQIRAIQIDYNPVRVGGFTNHNARFGAGIVF